MEFISFSLKNFRGITEELNIEVDKINTLVGMNESGKTTILEGIYTIGEIFNSIDNNINLINSCKPKVNKIVDNKLKIGKFSGCMELGCNFVFNLQDLDIVSSPYERAFYDDLSIYLGNSSNSEHYVKIKRVDSSELDKYLVNKLEKYLNTSGRSYSLQLTIKIQFNEGKFKDYRIFTKAISYSKNTSVYENREVNRIEPKGNNNVPQGLAKGLWRYLPSIKYLEEFELDIPEEIIYTNTEQTEAVKKNQNEWKHIFDVLASSVFKNSKHKYSSFQEAVIGKSKNPPQEDKQELQDNLEQINEYLNEVITTQWKKFKFKGQENNFQGFKIISDHYSYCTIRAKTSVAEFKLSERSKGCRWFFCFKFLTDILANQYEGEVIFLLDEPASNLHIYPQSQILESLHNLSKRDNVKIIYSTHSPYLLNITLKDSNIYGVTNQSADPDSISNITLRNLKIDDKNDDNNINETNDQKDIIDHSIIEPICDHIIKETIESIEKLDNLKNYSHDSDQKKEIISKINNMSKSIMKMDPEIQKKVKKSIFIYIKDRCNEYKDDYSLVLKDFMQLVTHFETLKSIYNYVI